MPAHKYTPEEFVAAFWSRVDKSPGLGPEGECWPWTGTRNQNGYGVVTVDGTRQRAHRVAWAITNGPIPEGLHACHHCDNPPCCNPAHLFLGTPGDNMADMNAKGRHAPGTTTGDRNGMRARPDSVPRGSHNGSAKLTEADIPEIRAALARRELQSVVARRYGVSEPTIARIRKGENWRHVGDALPRP